MSQSRVPSPARSQGAPVTPRLLQTRGTRSVGSPARSTASGRLSSIIQFKDNNKDSFFLSPLPARRSVLNDDTAIEEPRRKSWWKKLSENSRDVMEVLSDNKVLETNEAVEEYMDIEVLSQEKKNYTLDLPESSDNESISSIVIPQRKLFTQKENQPQKKFAQLGGTRETLAKLHKTVQDKSVHVPKRNLFNQAPKTKSKPLFPAALLNISPNKTANKTKEMAAAEVKGEVRPLFGNRPGTKRKNMFADFIVSESEDDISEIQPKIFGFQKRDELHPGPSTAHNKRDTSPTSSVTTDIEMDDWRLLPSSTMVENQLEDMMVKTPVKRARLSKLPNIMESETIRTTNNSINKSRQSNKSTAKNKSKYFPDRIEDLSLKSLTRSKSKLLLEQIEAIEEHQQKNQEAMKEDLMTSNEEIKTSNEVGLQSGDENGIQNDEIEKEVNQISLQIRTPNVSHDTTGRRRKKDQSKVVLHDKSKKNESITVEKQIDDMMAVVDNPLEELRVNKLPDIKESGTIQITNTSMNKTKQSNKSATKNKLFISSDDIVDYENQSHRSKSRMRSNLMKQAEEEEENQKAEEEKLEVASTNESEAANDVLQYEDDDIEDEAGPTSSNNEHEIPNVTHSKTDQLTEKDQSNVHSPKVVLQEKTKQIKPSSTVDNQLEDITAIVNTPLKEAKLSKLAEINKSGIIETSNTSTNKTRQSNRSVTKTNSFKSTDRIEDNKNQSLTSSTRNKSKLLLEQTGAQVNQDVNREGQEVEEQDKAEEGQDVDEESQEMVKKTEKDHSNVHSPKVVLQEKTKQIKPSSTVENQLEDITAIVNTPLKEAKLSKLAEINKSGIIETSNTSTNKIRQSNRSVTKNNSFKSTDRIEDNKNQSLTSSTRNKSKLLLEQAGAQVNQDINREGQEVEEQDEAEEGQDVDEESVEVEEEDGQEKEEESIEEEDDGQEIEEESVEVEENGQAVEEESDEVEEDGQEVDEESHEVEEENQEVEEEGQALDEENNEMEEGGHEIDEGSPDLEEEDQEVKEQSQEVEEQSQEVDEQSQEVDEQSQEVEEDNPEEESTEEIEPTNEDEDNEENDEIAQESGQPSFTNESGTKNVSHDTTGRHRQKEQSKENSPEVILHDKTKQMESFTAKGRNTSLRRTSIMMSMNIRPSLAPHRDSTGLSDGTKNSSAEGSGWDSHRTTRRTLRQTFGKDFSPRKSLRALVMEKSAKRQTAVNDVTSVTSKFPQANSTELPEASNIQEDDVCDVVLESDHEVSKRTRQTTLEMYLQKIKKQNIERKMQMEEIVRNSLKVPSRDTFKVPAKPMFAARKSTKQAQSKPKAKQFKSTLIPLEDLPADVLEDMKYKPPKRFQPSNAAWITKRLYKFLETKLEPKYDYKARLRAEKLVATVYQFCRELRRCEVAPAAAVQTLKEDMARLQIATTHFEFYQFFHDYMPREVRVKVVPDVVNKIPLPRKGVFSDILRENAVHE